MSDNITKLHRPGPKPGRIILLCAAVLLAAAVLAVYLFWERMDGDALLRRIRYGKDPETVTLSFDAHSSNRYARCGDGIAVASVSGVDILHTGASRNLRITGSLSNPQVLSGDDLALCYDVGGRSLTVIDGEKGAVLETEAIGGLFDAYISAGDTVCTSASESGYKTVLRVYDARQKEIYRWFSATQFMPVCAVSPNGKSLAAVSLGQENGSFRSFLQLFRTDSTQPEHSVSLGGGMIYDLAFVNPDTVCAIGEDAVTWVSTDGSILATYDLTSWYLQDYDLSGDGFALLSLNMYMAGDHCSVIALDSAGTELGTLSLRSEVLDISACGRYAAILTADTLTICSRDMEIYAELPNRNMATSVLMRSDGTAYAISSNSAELYIP